MHDATAIGQLITGLTDPCSIMTRWKVSASVAARAVQMAALLPFDLTIISGWRSLERQEELRRAGRPAADPSRSNHLSCPATALDFRVGVAATDAVKAEFGRAAVSVGFRWGGGSPVDPDTGIPSDWNHVDEGPRTT